MDNEREKRDRGLTGPLIIAAAIVVTGAASMSVIMSSINNAKEEIIEVARATPTPLDPFELHQRLESDSSASFEDAIETSLRSAAVAEEAYRVQNGEYTVDVVELESAGLVLHPDVVITVVADIHRSFCIQALHTNLEEQEFYYDSDVGRVLEGPEGITANCLAFDPSAAREIWKKT